MAPLPDMSGSARPCTNGEQTDAESPPPRMAPPVPRSRLMLVRLRPPLVSAPPIHFHAALERHLHKSYPRGPHETHLPAPQSQPRSYPRIPQAQVHQGRARDPQEPSPSRTLAPCGNHQQQKVGGGGYPPSTGAMAEVPADPLSTAIPTGAGGIQARSSATLHHPTSGTGCL